LKDGVRGNTADAGRTALVVLAVCFCLNMFGRGLADSYAVFLAPLEREFGWARSQLTSVYSVYMLVSGFAAPLVGTFFDRLGPRWVYAGGLACLGGTLFMASRLGSLWQFYLLVGVLVGIGVSMVGMVPASGLLSRWYRERLSRVLGIAFSAAGVGAVFFVPLSQFMIDASGWRFAYQSLGLGLLTLSLIVFFLPPWAMYAAGNPAYAATGAKTAGDAGWTLARAVRTKLYWGMAGAFFFTASGMYIVLVQLVVFLIDSGFPSITAASAFGFMGMLSAGSVMLAGFVAERFGVLRTVTTSYCGSIAGVLLLLALTLQPSMLLLVLFVPVYGLCMGVRGPIVSAICAREFAGPRLATIYGTIYSSNAMGAALGSLLGGVFYDLSGSYRVGLVFSLVSFAIALSVFWIVPELRRAR
jgi:MFS family permease